MHRYKLEFHSPRLDETRLREMLEQQFSARDLAIWREAPARRRAPAAKEGLPRATLTLLADEKPWRRKQMLEALGAEHSAGLGSTLQRLEASGDIAKVAHGVYVIAGAPAPSPDQIAPLHTGGGGPTQERILELLEAPLTAVELRAETGVPRQRVDQILTKLVDEQRVVRHDVAGERAQHVYVRSDSPQRQSLATRPPLLSESRLRILSALPPEVLCRATDVADCAAIAQATIGDLLEQLSAQGLVVTFKLSQRRYAGITPRGLSHPEYNRGAPKASPADLVQDFGTNRARFLQVLWALGELRTLDITHALPPDYLQGARYGSGQLTQRLENSRLIEVAEQTSGRHGTYRLTEKGQFAAAVLNRLQSPPAAEELRAAIAERRAARAEATRRRATKARGGGQFGSPALDAIVAALAEHGPLTPREIAERMAVKFKNPKSISLALKSLHERGAIRQVSPGAGRHRSAVWASAAPAPAAPPG